MKPHMEARDGYSVLQDDDRTVYGTSEVHIRKRERRRARLAHRTGFGCVRDLEEAFGPVRGLWVAAMKRDSRFRSVAEVEERLKNPPRHTEASETAALDEFAFALWCAKRGATVEDAQHEYGYSHQHADVLRYNSTLLLVLLWVIHGARVLLRRLHSRLNRSRCSTVAR
jgi:hypothetical protein